MLHDRHALALLSFLSWCTLLLSPDSAQIFTDKKYVRIAPGDSPADIVHRVPHVAPSARQLRWQQPELTGFRRFGVNTFTNKEWGDGTESTASCLSPTLSAVGLFKQAIQPEKAN